MLKRKVIGILLGITVFLLLVNSVVEQFTRKEIPPVLPGYSVAEAEEVLFSVINSFGIQPDWIKVVNKKFHGQDSLKHAINISIPRDLPIPVIIKDMRDDYPDSLLLVTKEIKKYGNTSVNLFRGETQLLNLNYEYKDDLVRPYCSLAFVMNPLETLDEEIMNRIIRNNFPFSISFVPSFANETEIQKLAGLDKGYVILLNDDIQDNLFKLTTSSSSKRLKNAVESIINSFGSNRIYFIDDKSDIFRSTSINFIKDEFRKKGITLYPFSTLVNLSEKDQNEIASLIKFYCSSSPADTTINIRMNIDDFLALESEIGVYKKKGHEVRLINLERSSN